MTKKTNSSDISLQNQIDQLEELITWFEQDDIDLEQAITKFEEGSRLAEQVKQRLGTLENNITVLKEKFNDAA